MGALQDLNNRLAEVVAKAGAAGNQVNYAAAQIKQLEQLAGAAPAVKMPIVIRNISPNGKEFSVTLPSNSVFTQEVAKINQLGYAVRTLSDARERIFVIGPGDKLDSQTWLNRESLINAAKAGGWNLWISSNPNTSAWQKMSENDLTEIRKQIEKLGPRSVPRNDSAALSAAQANELMNEVKPGTDMAVVLRKWQREGRDTSLKADPQQPASATPALRPDLPLYLGNDPRNYVTLKPGEALHSKIVQMSHAGYQLRVLDLNGKSFMLSRPLQPGEEAGAALNQLKGTGRLWHLPVGPSADWKTRLLAELNKISPGQ